MNNKKEKLFTIPFVLCFCINFLVYANYYVLIVIMAGYSSESLGADAATAGFTASIFMMGALAARFVSAPIIGKTGVWPALVVSAIGIAASSALYLAPCTIISLLVLRFAHGCCYGIAQTAATSLVTSRIPKERLGEGLGYYMLAMALGSALGPFVGTILMQAAGYAAAFSTCLALAALGVVCALPLKNNIHKKPAADSKSHTESVTQSAQRSTLKEATSRPARPSLTNKLATFIEMAALPISGIIGLVYLAYGTIVTYLNSFAVEANLTFATGLFFAVYSATMVICRPLAGKAFDRQGARPVMTCGFITFGIGLAAIGLAANDALLLAAAIFAGIGIGTLQPSGLAIAVQSAPRERLTAANATYFMAVDVAIGICPLLFGWVIPTFGYRTLYLAMAALAILTLTLYLVSHKPQYYRSS